MGDAVFVLRLGEDDDADVPQSVNGHLEAGSFHDVVIQHPILPRVPVSYLLEADAGEVPQDSFHRLGQLPLAQRILLSPDNVNVVWDVIGGVVSRFPLALALEPGADVVGGGGVSCR